MRGVLAACGLLIAASAATGGDGAPDPAAAARALAEICAANPGDVDARLRLGDAWLAAHDAPAADRAFEAVLALQPRSAAALHGRGRASQDLGKWAEAARWYGLAVEADPKWDPARARLALVFTLFRDGDEERMDAAIEKSLVLPAADQDPLLWEFAVHRALWKRDPALAVSRAQELALRFPKSPWGPSALGWAYSRQGKDREAKQALESLEALAKTLQPPPQRTRLSLPFEGRWIVLQGPGGDFSHRWHRSRHSWDFQALNKEGDAHAGKGERNEDYVGFGRPVLAPADGWVIEARDGVEDNAPGKTNSVQDYGNYVVLEHEPGEFSRLLHLRKGSLLVAPGQKVTRGQAVGKCGNSGYSSEPHLHFDLCTGRPPADVSRPAVFARYVRTRKWEPLDVADGCPQKNEWVEPFTK